MIPAVSPEQLARAEEIRLAYVRSEAAEFAGKALLLGGIIAPFHPTLQKLLEYGRELRDTMIWREPTMSGAVNVYAELSSSREWTVSGKPKPAARAVEFLHDAHSPDIETGMYVKGFEGFLQRRAIDNVTVGMTAFLNRPVPGKKITRMEYLDPTELVFGRQRQTSTEVLPTEKVWQYDGEQFRFDQVFLNYALPIGAKGRFVSPLTPVVPDMQLAYLIREHDTAALDGRRVRDVVLVGSDSAQQTLVNAILTQVALWAGADPAQTGIPVVSLNTPSGTKIADMVHMLSLSRLPEEFNREEFMFTYVNKISSALGLALRHFWNNEKTTNKALEEIQEQRQQQKGPAEFVKKEERLINRSGILNQFGGAVRFGFIEEIDAQSQLTNAQVLQATATALGQIATVFSAALSLEAMLDWMQSIRVLPAELELVDSTGEYTLMTPDQQGQKPGESTVQGNPSPSALATSDKPKKVLKFKNSPLQEGEVTINHKGEVIDHHYRVYAAATRIAEDTLKEDEEESIEQVFDDLIQDERTRLVEEATTLRMNDELNVDLAKLFYGEDFVMKTLGRLESGALEDDDYSVLSALVDKAEA